MRRPAGETRFGAQARMSSLSAACFIAAAAACPVAQPASAQGAPIKPAAVSDVGPWEAVLWTRSGTVDHCTLSRARSAPAGVSYAWYVDGQVAILGVETSAWQLRPRENVAVVVKPQHGRERKLTAVAASPGRANLQLGRDRSLLDDLQRSEQVDVRIGAVTARLAFDDFNAARVVLESCVQKIGAPYAPQDPKP